MKYIVDTLDENERQDFFRMKKIQSKKKQERREMDALLHKELEETPGKDKTIKSDEMQQHDFFKPIRDV